MIELFEWFKTNPQGNRTWLIIGKGPSFSKHVNYPNLDNEYASIGLNHVCRERPVFATHIVDLNVIDEIGPKILKNTNWLIMPWHPSIESHASSKTLEELAAENSIIKQFDNNGQLIWYNLSSSLDYRSGSPVVYVKWFSSEAVVYMLAIAGFKTIRTLGIDGGLKYADEFSDIQPLRSGSWMYNSQDIQIKATKREFGLDYKPLQ